MGIPFLLAILPLLAITLVTTYYIMPVTVQDRVKRFFDIEV